MKAPRLVSNVIDEPNAQKLLGNSTLGKTEKRLLFKI
jgi:hypothetical protein